MAHKQLSFKEHLRKRAFYGGSAVAAEHDTWILNEPSATNGLKSAQFIKRTLTYGDALLDNFDEILVNAIDHYYRSIGTPNAAGGPVDTLRIDFDETTGCISVWNNGPGIPVINDWPGRTIEGWLPEAIISQERSGSNFNDKADPDRVTGGMNGLGIKVSNAGSLEFEVETIDLINRKYYRQKCRDRMDFVDPPTVACLDDPKDLRKNKVIKKLTNPHTVIRWIPDYDNLCKESKNKPSVGWFQANKDTVRQIIQLRVYQTAAFLSTIDFRYNREERIEHNPRARVYFNNKLVKISKFADFLRMFGLKNYHVLDLTTSSDPGHPIRFPWYIGIGFVKELDREVQSTTGFEQMTISNGIHANLGGSHVNLMKKQIMDGIESIIKQKLSESIIDRLFCYFDLKQFPFSAFDFDSQTKNKIKIGREDLNLMKKQFELTPAQIKKIYNTIKDDLEFITAMKAEKDQNSATRRNRAGPIRKYDAAMKSGGKESTKCGLIVPEGDSANKTMRNMIKHKDTPIDMNYYGTYNIQGVPPNARKMIKIIINPHKKSEFIVIRSAKLRENISFQGLVRALGLDYAYHYDNTPEGNRQFATLNYGYIMISTDQDLDGIGHICSLILVFIMVFWPNLVRRGFVKRFATPIIRVYQRGSVNVDEFYSKKEYDEWITDKFGSEDKKPTQYKTEYYKGLGGHSKEEVFSMGMNFHENVFTFTYDTAAKKIMEAFYGEDTNLRKQILSTAMTDEYPQTVWSQRRIGASVHFQVETKEFQLANMRRKIKSCIDGMIPTQRKAFAGGRRMFANSKVSKVKVYQVSGYVAQHMHYANGDSSMNGVIMKMAQSYNGANNIPAFVPISDGFGDRVIGRSANAGPRYLDTKFNARIMDLIFPRHFDWLLSYTYEDGVMCEPKYYVPVIPMAILESETTTGTGWKIDVWARDLKFTLDNVRRMIKGFEPLSFNKRPWMRSSKMTCRYFQGREVCYGSYTYDKKSNCITITELPMRIWSYPYCCHLLGIDPHTGKTEKPNEDGELVPISKKPYIKKIKDDTSNYVNDIKIWLESGTYEKILETYGTSVSDPVEDFLDLRRYLTPNLNMIDDSNYIREFPNYENILKYWFPICLDMHHDYLMRDIILKDCLLDYLQNTLRFILADGSDPKEINIDKDFTDSERDDILIKHKYVKFNKSVLVNPKYTKAEELKDLIYGSDATYEYISDITVREKKKTEVSKLRKRIDDLEEELARLAMTDAETMWLESIDKIEETIKEGLTTDWMFETKRHVFNSTRKNSSLKKGAGRGKKTDAF